MNERLQLGLQAELTSLAAIPTPFRYQRGWVFPSTGRAIGADIFCQPSRLPLGEGAYLHVGKLNEEECRWCGGGGDGGECAAGGVSTTFACYSL